MTWQPELWADHSTNVAEADQAEEMHSKREDAGEWPGYAPEVQCLNLPAWVYGKEPA